VAYSLVYKELDVTLSVDKSRGAIPVPNEKRRRKALLGNLRASAEAFRVPHPEGFLKQVASDLFEALNTPVSLSCEILLRHGEIKQLLERSVKPSDYNDANRFRDDYQVISFLRKVPFELPSLDREGAAKEKFFAAEAQCAETNRRFRQYLSNPGPVGSAVSVEQVITLAQRKIRECLGPFDAREWLMSCRHGPGGFNHPTVRGLTSVYDKLQVTPSCTKDMAELGARLVMSSPAWARSVTDSEVEGFHPFVTVEELALIPGNRVTFVPKTALTDRSIAIEPLLNVYAQLGIGKMVRRRLKRRWIDLDDQTANQRAAREGSATGRLATIDLSSASDTVAKGLVSHLLPEEWYNPMDLTRSKVGFIDGKWLNYAKFSSMGNGFTFELETLIFWALSVSACVNIGADPNQVRVYGDDIVVPVEAYDLLEEVLRWCGFTLNAAKSFKEGPFRESCGKDFYYGQDVRPFLQKEVPKDLSSVFKLANGLARLASRRNHGFGRDSRLRQAWLSCVRALPQSLRQNCLVPAHAGDTDGLVEEWDYAQRSCFVREDRGYHGFWALRLTASPVLRREATNFQGALASLLYRCRDGFPEDGAPPASPRQGREYRWELRDRAFFGPWTNLGAWV
jgi:hypothetical protein